MDIDYLKDSMTVLYRKLVQNGLVDFTAILTVDDCELQELLELSKEEVDELKQSISLRILPSKKSVNHPEPRLSTGCKDIDSVLNGGLPTQRVLELFGCSGCGKTQFCLQLLLTVQLPIDKGGLGKSAVYICTEPPFPTCRFHSLCGTASEKFGTDKNDFESNVFINTCYDTEELLHCIKNKLPKLVKHVDVGLIIIDTIAAVFRGVEEENYVNRKEKFQDIVKCIRLLARSSKAVILCVNQVTDNLLTQETEASLGTTWAELVAQRYNISRADLFSSTRLFSIDYSYECNNETTFVEFHIGETGIV